MVFNTKRVFPHPRAEVPEYLKGEFKRRDALNHARVLRFNCQHAAVPVSLFVGPAYELHLYCNYTSVALVWTRTCEWPNKVLPL